MNTFQIEKDQCILVHLDQQNWIHSFSGVQNVFLMVPALSLLEEDISAADGGVFAEDDHVQIQGKVHCWPNMLWTSYHSYHQQF